MKRHRRNCGRAAHISLISLFLVLSTNITADTTAGKTDRIIIKYAQPAYLMDAQSAMAVAENREDKLQLLAADTGTSISFHRLASNGAEVYQLDSLHDIEQVNAIANRISQDPAVEYAEPDLILHPMAIPNDSRYQEQWHYYETTGGLNLPTVWDNYTGNGVVVAVIDTGYLPHDDLTANIVGGYDMIADRTMANDGNGRDNDATDPGDNPGGISSWHGTHVAGTIAAITNNGIGIAGVAYGARILPIRVLGVGGGYTSDIADGIIWAAGGNVRGIPGNPNPAQVINLSLGGKGSCGTTSQNAINLARANGATVVVAAGNSNDDASGYTPASCSGVISVAATNRTGDRAYYSNFGSVVDVAAPGGETSINSNGILSTLDNNSYAFYQGTSMAAPHVAGLAALLYEADPTITPDEVETIITDTARDFPGTCTQCGTGIANALAAINAVTGTVTPPPPPSVSNKLDNGIPVTGITGATQSEITFTMTVPTGATDLSFSINGGPGDADLYVKYGSKPTRDSYDCRPFLGGNSETCTMSNIQAGEYHIMIRAYQGYSGLTLTGSYTKAKQNSPILYEDKNISGRSGSWKTYSINLPGRYSKLEASITGNSGDADLYVRKGAKPTNTAYTCRPYKSGSNESCSTSAPGAGIWYISIYAYSSFQRVDLKITATP